MTGDIQTTPHVQTTDASAELCDLLSAQIAHAHDGNLVHVERLCARADAIVTQLKETGSDHSVTGSQRARLAQLYDELVLTLKAEHADVEDRLKQLRRVKRAVGVYGRKIRS